MSESYQAEALFQQLYEAVHSFYGLPDLPERELWLQESFQPFPLLLQKFLPFLYGKHGYGF